MTQTYRIQNAGSATMIVRVEMWCDEIPVPVGSVLALTCETGAERLPITIEQTENGLVFWPECASYSAMLDGHRISLGSQSNHH